MILATIPRLCVIPNSGPFDQRFFLCHHFRKVFDELGVPLMAIVNNNGIDAACDACDALILPGSATNIHPSYYGREVEEGDPYPFDEYKDDKAIIDRFVRQNKPIFGICGGLQTLNVYFGGTLKKVPGHTGGDAPQNITVTEGSFLHRAHGATSMNINSYHFWGIDDVAPGVKVTGVSDDGVIEAIEKDNIVAFQWHPEIMHDVTLFRAFLDEYVR